MRKGPEVEAADIERVAEYSDYVSAIRQYVDCVDKADRADEVVGSSQMSMQSQE